MARKATFIVKADVSRAVYNCLRKLDAYDQKTSDSIRKIVKDSTANVFAGALRRVPVRSGALKKSIRMRFEDTPTNTVGIVYTNEPTAHLIERGAGPVPVLMPIKKKALHPGGSGYFFTRASIPARKAKPFLKPAMDDERPRFEVKVREAVTKT